MFERKRGEEERAPPPPPNKKKKSQKKRLAWHTAHTSVDNHRGETTKVVVFEGHVDTEVSHNGK